MASFPRYQKTYLLCTISLEYSATVKKNPKFPSILKSHWKSSLRPFFALNSSIIFFIHNVHHVRGSVDEDSSGDKEKSEDKGQVAVTFGGDCSGNYCVKNDWVDGNTDDDHKLLI